MSMDRPIYPHCCDEDHKEVVCSETGHWQCTGCHRYVWLKPGDLNVIGLQAYQAKIDTERLP